MAEKIVCLRTVLSRLKRIQRMKKRDYYYDRYVYAFTYIDRRVYVYVSLDGRRSTCNVDEFLVCLFSSALDLVGFG